MNVSNFFRRSFSLLAGLVFLSAHARQLTDACVKQVKQSRSWPDFSETQSRCVEDDTYFKKFIESLCKDSDLSPRYKKYLEYSYKLKKAQDEFNAATDAASRNAALSKLQQIRQDMAILADVEEAIGEIEGILYRCGVQKQSVVLEIRESTLPKH